VQVKRQLLDPASRSRIPDMIRFEDEGGSAGGAPFPAPPATPEDMGVPLEGWMPQPPSIITL
jgi:hypothetical protein